MTKGLAEDPASAKSLTMVVHVTNRNEADSVAVVAAATIRSGEDLERCRSAWVSKNTRATVRNKDEKSCRQPPREPKKLSHREHANESAGDAGPHADQGADPTPQTSPE